MANQLDSDDSPHYSEMQSGTWRDFLPRWQVPVVAFGSRHIYRVMLQGRKFNLPWGEKSESITGFFTTRWVAARDVAEAQEAARVAVLREWKRDGFEERAKAVPSITIEVVEIFGSKFRSKAGRGFTFFDVETKDE
jgi:hypothetical protein